jgi:hypothetical protein
MTVQAPYTPRYGSGKQLTATASSQNATIDAQFLNQQVAIENTGSGTVYVKTFNIADSASATASAIDFPVSPGDRCVLSKSQTHDTLAYYSESGSTLQVTAGDGWSPYVSSSAIGEGGAPLGSQTTLPTEEDPFTVIANAPQKTFRCGFEAAVASGLDTSFFSAVNVGSGMSASQAGGSAFLISGTTTYAESIYRSTTAYSANMSFRYSTQLSQRIANQEFYVELVDVIGDGLAYTINSAVSVTVTIPNNTFTAANVGQSMYIGAMTVASCPTGRWPIASVSGNAVTFTVAGFPASGSGTCSLFGRNFHHVLYDGTTATNAKYDACRGGYSSGDTTAGINTSASPGHVATIAIRDATSNFLDQLSASSVNIENVLRASRVRNVPEDHASLYIQIRMVNGSVAPASTTTWTLGFIEIENFIPQQVSIVGVAPQGLSGMVPVTIGNTPPIQGGAAHSAAISGNPVRVAGAVKTAVDTTLVANDVSDFFMTTGGANVVKLNSIPEADWQYAAAASGILNTTTAVTIKAAAGAGIRNYITSIDLMAEALTNATEIAVRDGAAGTVIWRTKIGTGGLTAGRHIDFQNPLKGTANTLLEVVTLTASGAGAVYINAQGYTAP